MTDEHDNYYAIQPISHEDSLNKYIIILIITHTSIDDGCLNFVCFSDDLTQINV